LEDLYWSITYRDVKTKVKITLGQKQAEAMQEYQNIAHIVGKAFGGDDKPKGETPSNFAEAQSQFNKVLGKG
jgi:hypothetical protein